MREKVMSDREWKKNYGPYSRSKAVEKIVRLIDANQEQLCVMIRRRELTAWNWMVRAQDAEEEVKRLRKKLGEQGGQQR